MPDKDIQRQGSIYEEEPAEVIESASPKRIIILAIVIIIIGILGITAYTLIERGKETKAAKPDEINQSQLIDNSYTPEQIEMLRVAGYTGKEIEEYQKELADVDYLVKEAKKKQEEILKNTYEELKAASMSSASLEFKELQDKTWLGGSAKKVTTADIMQYETESKKEIVDYVKLPARGNQLFIRLTMNDGTYAFMSVHPSRWCQLTDSGNIVVTYESIKFGEEFFIMNLTEVQI